jgi:hypothetical protein
MYYMSINKNFVHQVGDQPRLYTRVVAGWFHGRVGTLAALHVSSDIFAHHQEHRNCIHSLWYNTRESLPAGFMGESEMFHLFHETSRQRLEAVNTV